MLVLFHLNNHWHTCGVADALSNTKNMNCNEIWGRQVHPEALFQWSLYPTHASTAPHVKHQPEKSHNLLLKCVSICSDCTSPKRRKRLTWYAHDHIRLKNDQYLPNYIHHLFSFHAHHAHDCKKIKIKKWGETNVNRGLSGYQMLKLCPVRLDPAAHLPPGILHTRRIAGNQIYKTGDCFHRSERSKNRFLQ